MRHRPRKGYTPAGHRLALGRARILYGSRMNSKRACPGRTVQGKMLENAAHREAATPSVRPFALRAKRDRVHAVLGTLTERQPI